MKASAINYCQEKLKHKKIPFRQDVALQSECSFRIGGICPLMVEPQNLQQLLEFLAIMSDSTLNYRILGGGSNLLISDHPDDFIVLRLEGNFKEFSGQPDGSFSIGASCNTTPTFRKISRMGYSGAEFLSTIPGRVGGAVIQNAGCYGGQLFDWLESVDIVREGSLQRIPVSAIEFGYRTSQFLQTKDSIITGIQIRLPAGKLEEIESSLAEKRQHRNRSQPQNKKSAGSIFKNPSAEVSPLKAWQLIDKVGLRGKQKGDALISPEHCNFIVNTGQATAHDVDYLIQTIRETIAKEFSIQLEKEVEYFGNIP